MTTTYTQVASLLAWPRLDTRRPGRYRPLDAHHARLNLQSPPPQADQPVARPVHTSFRRSARLLIGCR